MRDAFAADERQPLLLGTRAGMSPAEVLVVVPASAVLPASVFGVEDGTAVVVVNNDIELVGLDASVRFAFLGDALVRVTVVVKHRGPSEATTFDVKSLVVMLGESFGPATRLEQVGSDTGRDAAHGSQRFSGVWRTEAVTVELDVVVDAVGATGRLVAEHHGAPLPQRSWAGSEDGSRR